MPKKEKTMLKCDDLMTNSFILLWFKSKGKIKGKKMLLGTTMHYNETMKQKEGRRTKELADDGMTKGKVSKVR